MDGVQCGSEHWELGGELRRLRDTSCEAAYLLRLCCIRLVLDGQRPDAVGGALGINARSIRRWVDRYQGSGLSAVGQDPRGGRPTHLSQPDLERLLTALRGTPRGGGLDDLVWSGALVQRYVQGEFGVSLGLRQCQRLLGRSRRRASDVPARVPVRMRAAATRATEPIAPGPASVGQGDSARAS